MDVNKLIYFCNLNFWYVFEVPIQSIYNPCHEIRFSLNHYGNMSKRKADFGTPEKENKRPKTFGTSTASQSDISRRVEDRQSRPCYNAESKAMFCDFCILKSASIRTSSLRVAVFLRKNM